MPTKRVCGNLTAVKKRGNAKKVDVVIDASSSKAVDSDDIRTYNCPDCLKEVSDDQPGLTCDGCKMWFHVACEKVSDSVYEFLSNHGEEKSICWFCKGCEMIFRRFSSAFVKMEEAQKRMEEKVDAILTKLNSKSVDEEYKEVHERIEQKVDALTSNVEKQGSVSVQDIVCATRTEDKVEEEEIKRRSTSIIIHGLAEPQASTPESRKQEDEDTTETLLHSLNLDDISVHSVIRLGRRPEAADAKPRPIKMVVASEEQKVRVLSKAKNLPRKGEGAPHIFMHQDLTPKQRKLRQELVKELRERQSNGEANLMIANWKIVVKRGSRVDQG